MTDATPLELSAQDQADIAALYSDDREAPSYHTILEVWREVLKPAEQERDGRVTAAWANRIVTAYTEVTYADMVAYRDTYFGKIEELKNLLDLEIASDPDCLTHLEPALDAAENAHHYKNLLMQWQLTIQQWELDWDCTAPGAGVEVAAISEVHKMFFGQTGITAFLDNISFEFTEADQQMLGEALLEHRGEGR